MGYAVRLTKDEGLPTMVKRGAGFVRRRFFGKILDVMTMLGGDLADVR